jgi:hypothetical protein
MISTTSLLGLLVAGAPVPDAAEAEPRQFPRIEVDFSVLNDEIVVVALPPRTELVIARAIQSPDADLSEFTQYIVSGAQKKQDYEIAADKQAATLMIRPRIVQ